MSISTIRGMDGSGHSIKPAALGSFGHFLGTAFISSADVSEK